MDEDEPYRERVNDFSGQIGNSFVNAILRYYKAICSFNCLREVKTMVEQKKKLITLLLLG